MHLLENIIPALVSLWTGTYKDIHGGHTDYVFSGSAFEALGEVCAASSRTIPTVFGARIPNIATQRYQFIAETWILFATLLGPALLHRHFSKKEYYDHFIQLAFLVNLCLQLELSDEDIHAIEHGFATWVKEYERRLYYQNCSGRLPVCTLPVHALLHVADDIRNAGPVWCYWAFPMERFCGVLGRAVKNRKHPYISLSHRVRDVAQLNQIKLIYCLSDELDLSDSKEAEVNGHRYASYPDVALVPPSPTLPVSADLRNKIASHLATVFDTQRTRMLRFVPTQLKHWTKLKIVDGDLIHASHLAPSNNDSAYSRDATYARYTLDIDKYRNQPTREPEFVRRVYYGQVLSFFELSLPADSPHTSDDAPTTHVLAQVACHHVKSEDERIYYYDSSCPPPSVEVIDVDQIDCLIGRVKDDRRWVILERPAAAEKVDFASELREIAVETRL
ncbi:hypothetical protein GGG16DRAFT_63249 [Schizophyllum commune]